MLEEWVTVGDYAIDLSKVLMVRPAMQDDTKITVVYARGFEQLPIREGKLLMDFLRAKTRNIEAWAEAERRHSQ